MKRKNVVEIFVFGVIPLPLLWGPSLLSRRFHCQKGSAFRNKRKKRYGNETGSNPIKRRKKRSKDCWRPWSSFSKSLSLTCQFYLWLWLSWLVFFFPLLSPFFPSSLLFSPFLFAQVSLCVEQPLFNQMLHFLLPSAGPLNVLLMRYVEWFLLVLIRSLQIIMFATLFLFFFLFSFFFDYPFRVGYEWYSRCSTSLFLPNNKPEWYFINVFLSFSFLSHCIFFFSISSKLR